MYADIYRESRQRTAEILRGLDEQRWAQRVPACPEWTVRDLAAHLAGVAADVVASSVDPDRSAAWTAGQIQARRNRTLDQILDEWDSHAAQVEKKIRNGEHRPVFHGMLVHEADLRGALGLGRPPRQAWLAALDFAAGTLDERVLGRGRLVIHTDEENLELGSGEPVTTLEVAAYELWRGLTGRRSRAQMLSWSWLPHAGEYVDVLPMYPPNPSALVEPA